MTATIGAPGVARGAAANSAPAFDLDVSHMKGGEPEIAVSPTNPQDIVMGFKGGLAVSHDRGHTWTLTPEPAAFNDSVVAVDRTGRFYVGWIAAAVGSDGALGTIQIISSDDGGRSWSAPVDAIGPDSSVQTDGQIYYGFSGVATDRPWIGVDDRTGTVYVSAADHSDAPGGENNITGANEVTCRINQFTNPFIDCGRRYVTASHDHGQTWGPLHPLDSPAYPGGYTAFFAGQPLSVSGVLMTDYLASRAPGSNCGPCVVFETSRDEGVTWTRHVVPGASVVIATGLQPFLDNPTNPISLVLEEDGDILFQPYLAVDPAHPGTAALLIWNKPRTQLLIYRTSDWGARWEAPEVLDTGSSQQMRRPWIAYSPTGDLGVFWRTVHSDGTFDEHLAVAPGGRTFSTPVTLSSAPSPNPGDQNSVDDASYLVLDGTYAHAGWGDQRSGGELESWYSQYRYGPQGTGGSR